MDNVELKLDDSVDLLTKETVDDLWKQKPKVPGYTIHGEVDRGSFGVVYEAVDDKTKRRVAIKQQKCEWDDLNTCALREISIMRRLHELDGNHIVPLYGCAHDDHNISIVMEYVPYTLTDFLGSKVSIPWVRYVMRSILKALEVAHAENILHRDLKPSNILIRKDGHLYVGDWGAGRQFQERVTLMTPGVTTPGYRAPELILRQKYGFACDMWSVGSIMARLLGEPIHRFESDLAELTHIVKLLEQEKWICFVPYITPLAEDLLRKLWVWDPCKRISASAALKHVFINEE